MQIHQYMDHICFLLLSRGGGEFGFILSKVPDCAGGRAVCQGVHRHALRGPALLDLVPEGAFLGQGLDMQSSGRLGPGDAPVPFGLSTHSLMCAVSVIRAKILYHTLCNLISLTSHSKAIASNVSCQPTAENPQKDPLREPAARACHEVYVAVMRPS